jgi:hypothetical protein
VLLAFRHAAGGIRAGHQDGGAAGDEILHFSQYGEGDLRGGMQNQHAIVHSIRKHQPPVAGIQAVEGCVLGDYVVLTVAKVFVAIDRVLNCSTSILSIRHLKK